MTHDTCSIDGCVKPRAYRGWCSMHYSRWKRCGDPLKTKSGRVVREPGLLCAADGCDRPRTDREWCASHYGRWRRTGEAGQLAYTVGKDRTCVVCGVYVAEGSGRRSHCSGRCQAMDSRHGKNRPKTAECVRCGAEIDLLALTPAGQFKRVDTKTCDTCKRAKSLRHKVSAMEVAKAHGTDCGICGEPVDMALKFPDPRSKSIDHVIPYAHGGTHDMGNLRVAHLRCNHVKSDRISYRAG